MKTKLNKRDCLKDKILVESPQQRDRVINQRQKYIAGLLLFGMSTFMAVFIIIGITNNPTGFINYMGINKTALEIPLSWGVAIFVSICYIIYSARMIPVVRQNLLNFSCWFKLLGVYAAFSSGIVEELIFRQMLMNWLDINGLHVILQIIISALTFGLLHFSWSLFGKNIKIGIDVVATFGEVHPEVLENYDINKRCYLAEVNITKIVKYSKANKKYEEVPKFPAVERDIAIVVDEDVEVGSIENIITKKAKRLLKGKKGLEELKLFDIYRDEKLGKGKKSIAYSLIFRDKTKSLSDEEINPIMEEIIKELEEKFNATLRK